MSTLKVPTIGYTSQTTVMLDFDDTCYNDVKYWASMALEKFQLGGIAILQSSKRHYHVVYNRKVTYKKNVSIIADICLEIKKEGLTKWFLLQCIKKEFTLRVSAKGNKPPPKIIFHYGKQDKEIYEFLQHRRMIKNNLRNISRAIDNYQELKGGRSGVPTCLKKYT